MARTATLILISLLFSCSAHSAQNRALGSDALSDFTVSSDSTSFTLRAKGSRGSMSKVGNILAAENVALNLYDHFRKTTKVYQCSSFTFYLIDLIAVCDVPKNKTSLLLDVKNSEISFYPSN
jgi:hypothetical protein